MSLRLSTTVALHLMLARHTQTSAQSLKISRCPLEFDASTPRCRCRCKWLKWPSPVCKVPQVGSVACPARSKRHRYLSHYLSRSDDTPGPLAPNILRLYHCVLPPPSSWQSQVRNRVGGTGCGRALFGGRTSVHDGPHPVWQPTGTSLAYAASKCRNA